MNEDMSLTNEEEMKVKVIPCAKNIKQDVVPEKYCARLCSLSFTIRKALSPIDMLMKICGLTYGSSCPLRTQFRTRHKVQLVHTILVVIIVLLSFFRYVPSLFKTSKYPQFLKYEYLFWQGKCTVQAFYCIFICSRYKRKISRLQSLIAAYDDQLNRYRDTQDMNAKRKYRRSAKVVTATLFGAVLISMVLIAYYIFHPSMGDKNLYAALFEPFEQPGLPVKLLFLLSYFYLTVAWLLPVILYCNICLSFCLILDQFQASLTSLQCNRVNKRVEYVREEYHKLQQLLTSTDDVIGFMALCVYCFDVILCCFHLFHFFYHAKSVVDKLAPAYRTIVSLANLFFMSLSASTVTEKVCSAYCPCSHMTLFNSQ